MLFTSSFTFDLLGVSVALLVVAVVYYKWALTYWERRGLQGLKTSFPFGNCKELLLGQYCGGEMFRDIYFDLKSKGLKHGGVYLNVKSVYVPVELDLVKRIFQTDFQHFMGHGLYINEEIDPLSAHLFNLDGPRWKAARSKFTPTFTPSKMKMMFQTLLGCSDGLKELLLCLSEKGDPIDLKDVMGRFASDIIGSSAFGIDCNSMKNPDSEFRKYGEKAVGLELFGAMRVAAQLLFPHCILKLLRISPNDPEVVNFFLKVVKETVEYREKHRIAKNDFMHLLIQMKNGKTITDEESARPSDKDSITGKLSLNEISAQCFLFFVAGFETSSTTMNFASYEMAVNDDIQEKVREEINAVLEKHDNKITYEALSEMSYLEQVINETLRKYPPLPAIFRICNENYKVPGTDVVIEKGTSTMLPVLGIHYDPEYYPEPDKFDPKRFTPENKIKRPPFTWLPFGQGPRECLGLRFGILQTKLGLVTLLRNYRISINNKTTIPLVFNPKGIVLATRESIWIDINKIDQ